MPICHGALFGKNGCKYSKKNWTMNMQIVHPSSYTDSFAVHAQDLILKVGSMIFEVEHISCKLLKLNPEIVIKIFYIIF